MHGKRPKHVAIIMDGNGRWAKQRGLERIAGHEAGSKSLEKVIKKSVELKIPYLTLFAFSSENWSRPKAEVDYLMQLFLKTLTAQTEKLHESNIKINFIGNQSQFELELQQQIQLSQEKTAKNTGLFLTLAVNYGGQWDILEASKKLAEQIAQGDLNIDQLNETTFANALSTFNLPSVDFFIRTSGEKRISNFMLWQIAYAELYFTDILWPDFDEIELEKALKDFAGRERRYGKTTEQTQEVTAC